MNINPVTNLFGRINGNQLTQGLNQITGMAQAMSNPQMAIPQMFQNDPRIGQIINMINQNGGNGKALFYQIAQQKGLDPDTALSQIQESYNSMMGQNK